MEARRRLDLTALGAFSKQLAAEVFNAIPQLQQHAWMIPSGEPDGLSLDVVVPSPTLDEPRLLEVWVDEVATPSIGFGPTHRHESPDAEGIAAVIDLARAVLADQVVIIEDVGGQYPGHGDWIDLREPDALVDALTSPYSPGRAILKSWSGSADRNIDTESV
jgi:hypothetical protein